METAAAGEMVQALVSSQLSPELDIDVLALSERSSLSKRALGRRLAVVEELTWRQLGRLSGSRQHLVILGEETDPLPATS